MKSARLIVVYLFLSACYQLPEFIRNRTGSDGMFLGLMALFLLLVHVVLRKQGRDGLQAAGLHWKSGSRAQLLTGLLVQASVTALAFGLSCALGLTRVTQVPPPEQLATGLLIFSIGTLLPSLAEDVLTRGYLFAHGAHRLSARTFVLLSTGLFVLNHAYRLQNGPTTWVFLAVMGVSLALPLVLTRSLWLTFGLHWGNNIVYQLTNNVIRSEDVTDFSSTWVLTGAILLMTFVLPLLVRRLGKSGLTGVTD